jgi:DNA-binding NarL/FixJ family response regulator
MPDVVLMDLVLSEGDGRQVIRRIVADYPTARIVAYTAVTDSQHVLGAFDAGAIGYLQKGLTPQQLIAAIFEAAQSGSPLSARAAVVLVTERRRRRPESALTPREREVLVLVAEGMTNSAIATQLQISEKTVKVHVTRILETLRVPNRTQAALWFRTRRIP